MCNMLLHLLAHFYGRSMVIWDVKPIHTCFRDELVQVISRSHSASNDNEMVRGHVIAYSVLFCAIAAV